MASRTKDIIEGLPAIVRTKVEDYRFRYTHTNDFRMQAEVRMRMGGYVLGLRDAGLITEFERRVVFCYMTVASEEA